MARPLPLKCVVAWNAVCAIWMSYVTSAHMIAFVRRGDAGGYGVFVDREVLLTSVAIPTDIVSLFALMGAGRKAEIAIDVMTLLAYWLVVFGLWRGIELARLFAIGFFTLGFALLSLFLGYIAPAFSRGWPPDYLPFVVAVGMPCLAFNGWVSVYLLRPNVRDLFQPKRS